MYVYTSYIHVYKFSLVYIRDFKTQNYILVSLQLPIVSPMFQLHLRYMYLNDHTLHCGIWPGWLHTELARQPQLYLLNSDIQELLSFLPFYVIS